MSWTSELKVGDFVILSDRQREHISTVERLTKTQIIISGTSNKYRRETGSSVGDSTYYCSYLSEATEERKDRVRLANKKVDLVIKFRRIDPAALTIDQLSGILGICESEVEK